MVDETLLGHSAIKPTYVPIVQATCSRHRQSTFARMVNRLTSGAGAGQTTSFTSLPHCGPLRPMLAPERVLRRQPCIRRSNRRRLKFLASLDDIDSRKSDSTGRPVDQEAISEGSGPTQEGSSRSSSDEWEGALEDSDGPTESSNREPRAPTFLEDEEVCNPNPGMVLRADLRADLLATIAGLDRGFAATATSIAKVQEAAERLETVEGIVSLTECSAGPMSSKLSGIWRLVYSSGFATGSLGGARPGPFAFQLSATPFSLGQIYQKISFETGTLDNIVEFNGPQAPQLPWSSTGTTPAIRLSLIHDFNISTPSRVLIKYTQGSIELLNSGLPIPRIDLPPVPDILRQLANSGLSTDAADSFFSVGYLDNGLRVTHGDRGELRVYIRDDGSSGLQS